MRKYPVAAALLLAASMSAGGPAVADEHVAGGCPNDKWVLTAADSDADANDDGFVCVKETKGKGNSGDGFNVKDNNKPLP